VSGVRCTACGRDMIGIVLNEVATVYGCSQGCTYAVLDDDDLHKLSTPAEVGKIRDELAALRAKYVDHMRRAGEKHEEVRRMLVEARRRLAAMGSPLVSDINAVLS
jgi:hypothetical protein